MCEISHVIYWIPVFGNTVQCRVSVAIYNIYQFCFPSFFLIPMIKFVIVLYYIASFVLYYFYWICKSFLQEGGNTHIHPYVILFPVAGDLQKSRKSYTSHCLSAAYNLANVFYKGALSNDLNPCLFIFKLYLLTAHFQ